MDVFWTGVFTLVGVGVGGWLALVAAERQSKRGSLENAHQRVVEALAAVDNLLWDYVFIASETSAIDVSQSRVDSEYLNRSSERWHAIRPLMTAVSIGDPSPEIRRLAGELVRATSLFTRSVDWSGRSDEAIRSLAKQSNECTAVALAIEKENLKRWAELDRRWWNQKTDSAEPELDRLKGDRRFSKSNT